ncbi:MAG: hypothetical protein ABR501_07795 [Pyrinomonadaceae bacterium]
MKVKLFGQLISISDFLGALLMLMLVVVPLAESVSGQTINPDLRPDLRRALSSRQAPPGGPDRINGYVPARGKGMDEARSASTLRAADGPSLSRSVAHASTRLNIPATSSIAPGTPLTQILHISQLSLSSPVGTHEQFVDRNGDLIADERTTFDSAGGSFDIAVGQSGSRYGVYSATLNGTLVGVLAVALDTNGDYTIDSSSTYNLRTDFGLPSAAAVVTGRSKAGREFVIVSSSGYFNSSDPGDPNNEASPGIVLLVRDPATGGFDRSRSRELVRVGDNRIYNANALALLPNNDLLVADFHSDELRIIRDTDNDGMPDTLVSTPYYSYNFSNDAPLDIAVNSRGVVFSHSVGNNTVLLAIYDDNADGRADRDEVCVQGLSIDDNLFLHGLTVDGRGNVYVIEDASGPADGTGGNGGRPQIDAFPDPRQDGFLTDGSIFASADDAVNQALTGLSFGALPPNKSDDPQFFVRQHYLDFLSREPDAGGLAYWTNQITSCGNNASCIEVRRINVSAAFFLSIEFRETGYLVYKMHKAAYGNLPGAPVPVRLNEFFSDTQQVAQGVAVGIGDWQKQMENNKQAFTAQFVARALFTNAYPSSLTPVQFVDALFANAGLSPSGAERTAAINEFNGATNTNDSSARARALRQVAENPTLTQQEFNRAFVLMEYFAYMRRNPNDPPDNDFAGYSFWLGKLNQFNGNYIAAEMVKAFISSIEYRQRFGS